MEAAPPPNWPQYGGISFRNVSARYRPGLPLVVRGLTCEIKPQEKVHGLAAPSIVQLPG